MLNFSWTVVEYTKDDFSIQLLFDDAVYISMAPGPSRDILQIEILQPEFFVDRNYYRVNELYHEILLP
jgi:hypothetical protein